MDTRTLSRWRNLGIIAHIDAGKTTLTERLLWASGAIHSIGEVHDGAATTDFSQIERDRGITIGAAAVRIRWTPQGGDEHRLTLIDTHGHIDFAIEVERSLRVLDGAVALFSAVDGVQPQSETLRRQARLHSVPLIAFVNKMDRAGAGFDRVLAQMRTKLDAHPWAIDVPLGAEHAFEGWVDLVGRSVVHWHDAGMAMRRAWNDDEAARYAAHRQRLIEAVAEHDDALAQTYLDERPIDDACCALRRGVLAGAGVPVLSGSAIRNKGIDTLPDAIVVYVPSPLDRPALKAERGDAETHLSPDPAGRLATLVFKIAHQAHGPVTFVRVYSGTLRLGGSEWSSQHGRMRRIGRLAMVQADRTHDVYVACAGQIVAVLGWKDAISGETLSDAEHRFVPDSIQAQPAVLSWRLSAQNAGDLIRLGQGLARLSQEDQSFRVDTDVDTGETLVWGMGELHLEVMVERLRSDWHVDVRTGAHRGWPIRKPRARRYRESKARRRSRTAALANSRASSSTSRRAPTARSCSRTAPAAASCRRRSSTRPRKACAPRCRKVHWAIRWSASRWCWSTAKCMRRIRPTTRSSAASEAVKEALARPGTALLEPVMTLAIDTRRTTSAMSSATCSAATAAWYRSTTTAPTPMSPPSPRWPRSPAKPPRCARSPRAARWPAWSSKVTRKRLRGECLMCQGSAG